MKQSTLRREWTPCQICANLDKETEGCKLCANDEGITDHPGFVPANDFIQFMFKNDWEMFKIGDGPHNVIILADSLKCIDAVNKMFVEAYPDRNYVIDTDLWGLKPHNVYETLDYCVFDIYGRIFIIPADEPMRDMVADATMLATKYDIYIMYDKSIKDTLKYRIDKRFYHIDY